MKKLKKTVSKIVNSIANSLSQTSVKSDEGEIYIPEGMSEALRQTASEGIVLLKNDGNILPLKKDSTVAVFGRVQYDYFAVGYGSGGDVNPPYIYNITDALDENGDVLVNEELKEFYKEEIRKNPKDDGFWGNWPRSYDEIPVPEDIVKKAAETSDSAVVVIGRSSGEDRENALIPGSYYLTDEEKDLLGKVCTHFKKISVLVNTGSIIDFSWCLDYPNADMAVLLVWQGGMESGRAVADVLTGKTTPSGKLADTVAYEYSDYPASENFGAKKFNNYAEDIFVGYRYFETFAPEKVLFPFGFGLSYSSFEIKKEKARNRNGIITLDVSVKNTGEVQGKEVVQVYVQAPDGMISKPAKALAAYGKTKNLAAGEAQTLKLSFKIADTASYDDSGKTGCKSCYVLEKGDYKIFIGNSVRNCTEVFKFTIDELTVTEKLSEMSPVEPKNAFNRMSVKIKDGIKVKDYEPVPVRTVSRKDRIISAIPLEIPVTGDMGYKLSDVKNGTITLDKFIGQLTDRELEALTRGDYIMNSPLGAVGNAAVYGGTEQSLRDKGVCPVTATDGPSGIRLACTASLLPVGAVLACSWNTELVTKIYELTGLEMSKKGSHTLLAPGMNIHRDPLCGRNFEYFSEDPFLTGTMGAAVVKGVQTYGVSACPKHFACNNQETMRNFNDSRVSERALREIYLKGFEICVKTAEPKNIMTSYNKINGVWAHYNYELVTGILRGEWGYKGCVMTDWWMRASTDPDFKKLRNNAYRVRAGVDVLMPGAAPGTRHAHYDNSLLESLGKKDGITRAEIQSCAKHTLEFVLNSYPFMNPQK